MREVLRSRRLRVAAGVSLVGLALVAAILHAPPVRARVLGVLIARARAAGFVVRAEGIDYSLVTLAVRLTGVSVATEAAASAPFFAATEIRASLPWRALTGRFTIDSLEILSPAVTLHRDRDGRDNFTTDRPGSSSEPLALHIGRLAVTNLAVDWTDDRAGSHVDAVLSLNLSSSGGPTTGPIVSPRPARVRWRGHSTSVSLDGARLSWNDRDLAVQTVALGAPEGTLRIDGLIESLLAAPRFDVRVEAEAKLAALSPWLDLERPLDGTAQASAHVTGSGVEIASLTARLSGGEIGGGGRVSFDGAGSARLTWRSLDLADLLVRALADPPRVLPASLASGSFDARWSTPSLERLDVTAKSALAVNARTTRRQDVPVDAALGFELRDRKWKMSVDRLEAAGAHATATFGGTVDTGDVLRSTVDGELHARTLADDRAWARALVRAGVFDAMPPIRGAASGDFAVHGTIGAPSLDGGIEATLAYQSLPAARIRSHALMSTGAIALDGIDARLAGAVARGAVRWTRGSDAIDGALEGTLPLKDLPILSASVPDSLALRGSLDVTVDVSGSRTRPHAGIRAAGRALEVAGQPIERLAAEARVVGTDVTVDRVMAEEDGGRIEAAGTLSLSSNVYTARASAARVLLHPVLTMGGAAESPLAARVDASFEGSGTLTDPGGRGRLSLASTQWRSADLGAIDADFTLAGRRATFEFAAPDVALNGQGTVGLDAAGALSVSASWHPQDLASIAHRLAVSTPVSGSAAATVAWTATRDRPVDGRGSLTVDSADVTLASQAFHLAQAGRVEVDARAIRVVPIVAATGSSRLTLAGELLPTATASPLSLTLEGSLADFGFVRDLLTPSDSVAEPLPVSGVVRAQILAAGSSSEPRITGTLRVENGRLTVTDGHDVSGVEVSARYEQGVLTVDQASAAFEGALMSATARVPSGVFDDTLDRLPEGVRRLIVPASGAATLSAQVRSITSSVVAPFVDAATLEQISLQADASMDLQADRPVLERVSGSATLGRAELSLAGVSFDQEVPTRVSLRDGRVTVDAFRWGRQDNQVVVQGGLTLAADPALDLSARAVLDLRMLNTVAPGVRTVGRGDAEVRVGGTLKTPTIDGFLTLSGGEARVADPRMVIADVNGTVTFGGDLVTFEHLSATINGGDAGLFGSIRLRGASPTDGSVTLTAKGVAIDVEGLRAESDAEVTWRIDATGPVLDGRVTLLRSAYRERFSVTGRLLAALHSAAAAPIRATSSLLDRTALDVRVVTDEDILVDNNVARLTLSADLRAVGTVSRPSLTGRAVLAEGGTVFFNGTRYRLAEQGSIDFANPARIEPDLDVSAVARVQGYDITLGLKGTPATLEPTLKSDDNPELSQSDLVSLLLIGRKAGDAGDDIAASGDQLIGLLTSGFLETAGRAIGFDTARIERGTPDVRLDAGLVAAETDPGARLTFGKTIGSHFDVVFSQSLQQSGGLTWIVGYKPRSGIDLRVVSLDDGDRLYTFSHDLTFGGPARRKSAAAAPARVGSVVITGSDDEAALRSRMKLQPGDRFSFFEWQDDRERVEAFYHDRRRLEARVVARRAADDADAGRMRLTYEIRTGPETAVAVEGYSLSKSAMDAIDRAWARSVADDFLIDEVSGIARGDLAEGGYLLPTVTAGVERTPDRKQLRLTIQTGPRARSRRVEFSGNASESTDRLEAVIAEQGLTRALWTDAAGIAQTLTAFYKANGYLNAAVRVEPVTISGSLAIRPIVIDEKRAFRLGSVRLEGTHAVTADEALRVLGLKAGDRYTEARVESGQLALDTYYRARGYNHVGIDSQTSTPGDQAGVGAADEVAVTVRVDEGAQQRLREIVTDGLTRTRPALVARALRLEAGAPVDLAAWNDARRRLYETGAFRSVDIQREAIEPAVAVEGAGQEEPIRARVTVQEWPPLRVRYGVEVRDELAAAGDAARANAPEPETPGGRTFGWGVAGDLAARGLFGTAMSAGVSGRYTLGTRASRAYLTAPSFFGRRLTSTVFVERSREEIGAALLSTEPEFETLKTDFTFEQRLRLARKTAISYLYTFERNHTRELNPNPLDPLPFDLSVTIGKFAATVLFDARNDLSDPSRGWFHSSNVQYAPAALGSDLRFLKYFVQQNYYRSVGRITLATAGRLGLATAFDTTLTPDQRFFAGGGNSVRGYAEDVLGPIDASGGAAGGNALIVLNEEVRFPIVWVVRGVGFFDAGRAFDRVGDMSLRALATSAGLGLRVQTPFVLLRVDMGVPFDDAFGARRARWFFSVGQLF